MAKDRQVSDDVGYFKPGPRDKPAIPDKKARSRNASGQFVSDQKQHVASEVRRLIDRAKAKRPSGSREKSTVDIEESEEILGFIIDQKMGFLEGNICWSLICWRKTGGVVALKKARSYLDKLIAEASKPLETT